MKRSKALILIANQLDFLFGKFEGFKEKFDEKRLNQADVILTTLEEAGMLPPYMENQEVCCYEESSNIFEHEWEKE